MDYQEIAAEYAWLKERVESDTDVTGNNDLTTVYRFLEKIVTLENLQHCVTSFRILLEDVEDEESRALVQKHFYIFLSTVYIDYLTDVIEGAENWIADSSGTRELQETILEKLVPIRAFYLEKLNE